MYRLIPSKLRFPIIGRSHRSLNACAYDSALYTLDPINPNEKKFDKILIANRGEIACRIIKTCRAMGIKTVAVHSDIDSNALHVKMADEAICVGPAPARESYLRMDKIIDAVKQTGAQAVHPGYGFLSENTVFARQLTEAGATFIGPNAKAIESMGDKIHSKRIATAAKVNMIPGFDGEITDADHCVKVAEQIGYPVMIKASAGGGGKGMRIAWNEKQARDGYRLSKQEAASSFGDDRMLVEKYIDNPRHIEMQVLLDKHGNALWLNERECSIQRRNQKVIEEAPSPFVDPDMRRRMGEQACALGLAVGYDSAGTVEFLVDSKKNFYFLEMNTRLQVEHPITEEITGFDLVHQMLRVAYGHKLNLKQSQVPTNGSSLECRVYAEDPYKAFGLPSIGTLTRYEEPLAIKGVRCDSGVRAGSEISIYYDSLICKLVTSASTRAEALSRMRDALDHYVIRGVVNNIPLLRDIVTEKRFQSGNITTKYLPETYPEGFKGTVLTEKESQQMAGVAAALMAKHKTRSINLLDKDVASVSQFHSSKTSLVVFIPQSDGRKHKHKVSAELLSGNVVKTVVDGIPYDIKADINLAQTVMPLIAGNDNFVIQPVKLDWSGKLAVQYKGSTFHLRIVPEIAADYLDHMHEKPQLDTSKIVVAPMPGLIKSVAVTANQLVSEGQELCVMEAMKMQNSLTAARSGKIKAVLVKSGQTVDADELLIELE